MKKNVNWNTLILTAGFSLMVWEGRRLITKLDAAYDDVLVIKTDMVHRQEFDVQITELKAQQNNTSARLANVEVEIQKLKNH